MRISIRAGLCTGCMNCQTVCSLTRTGVINRSSSAIRVLLDLFGGRHAHAYCRQCPDSKCAGACPEGAIRRVASTGAWVIRGEMCIMCGLCVEACPFGAVFPGADGLPPLKCDLCGGDPACIEACRFDAIELVEDGG